MDHIEDITITGFDPKRRPLIQNMPCIDLFLALSEKAPSLWCEIFNGLVVKSQYTIRIEPTEGLFIATWVRKADEVPSIVDKLKALTIAANQAYEAQVQEANRPRMVVSDTGPTLSPEQVYLDQIVEGLSFA